MFCNIIIALWVNLARLRARKEDVYCCVIILFFRISYGFVNFVLRVDICLLSAQLYTIISCWNDFDELVETVNECTLHNFMPSAVL